MIRLLTVTMFALAALAAPAVSFAADADDITVTTGTVTLSVTELDVFGPSDLIVLDFDWTSSADGNAVATTDFRFHGEIVQIITDPGATAPSDNYDLDLYDDESLDLLQGLGENRHTTTTQTFVPFIGNGTVTDHKVHVASTIQLNINDAGDSKIGEVKIYIRRY